VLVLVLVVVLVVMVVLLVLLVELVLDVVDELLCSTASGLAPLANAAAANPDRARSAPPTTATARALIAFLLS
jgi:hypothetical protein